MMCASFIQILEQPGMLQPQAPEPDIGQSSYQVYQVIPCKMKFQDLFAAVLYLIKKPGFFAVQANGDVGSEGKEEPGERRFVVCVDIMDFDTGG
jgi:hypothetical protein